MSDRIITLFGEELFSEPQKPAPKPKSRRKGQDNIADEERADEVELKMAPTAMPISSVATPAVEAVDLFVNTSPEAPLVTVLTEVTDTKTTSEYDDALATPIDSQLIQETTAIAEIDLNKAVAPEMTFTQNPSLSEPMVEDEALQGATTTLDTATKWQPIAIVPPATEVSSEVDEGLLHTEIAINEARAELTPVPAKATKKPKKQIPEDSEPQHSLPDDWKGEKQYYTIGEVAELFKVKTSHIRFWTNEFELKVRTTRKGDRLYTPQQVKEIKAIHHLVKERGFTLNGAKTKLKNDPKKVVVNTVDLKQQLSALRLKLVSLKRQLK